jgi:hypothetical protein
MRNFIASLLLGVFGTAAYADDAGSLVVVELYTSEGCSSCPPADKILTKIAQRDGILALALHVNYWDYLGWKDRFSLEQFTDRQEYYNMVLGGKYRLVTPQMFFQGRSYVAGAKAAKIEEQLATMRQQPDKIDLAVEKQTDGFRIRVGAGDANMADADIFIVQYKPNQVSEIKAGENRGKTLKHTNVVTSWERVMEWDGKSDLSFEQPMGNGTLAAVIVQAVDNGPILAARKLH